jgi:hypothetical protein
MGGSLEMKEPLSGKTEMELHGGKRKSKKSKKSKRRGSKGGSVLADMSVPAGLLFLNEFFKRKKSMKKVKFSKKRKTTRKAKKGKK